MEACGGGDGWTHALVSDDDASERSEAKSGGGARPFSFHSKLVVRGGKLRSMATNLSTKSDNNALYVAIGTLVALAISPFSGGFGLMLIVGILASVGAIGFTLSFWTSVALFSLWFFFLRVTPLVSKK